MRQAVATKHVAHNLTCGVEWCFGTIHHKKVAFVMLSCEIGGGVEGITIEVAMPFYKRFTYN